MPSKPARFVHARKRALNDLTVTRPRCEAVSAIDRPVAAWLKRNVRYTTALAAGGLERLALAIPAAATTSGSAAAAAGGRLSRCTAIAAPAGFVRESFACKELLLVRCEWECASAIDAVKGFVCVHLSLLRSRWPSVRATGVPRRRDSGKRCVPSSNRMAKVRRLRGRPEVS